MRFRLLKEQITSWMDLTETARTQLKSAPSQLAEEGSTSLQFRMAVGAHPVNWQERYSEDMARVTLVRVMAKEDLWRITFTT